jgi:DNA-directed RNA polymerase beta subunit
MDQSRRLLLRKFFEQHGTLSNQDLIFEESVIDKLSKDYDIEINEEDDIRYIRNRESYNILVRAPETFEVPMMNRKGFFIIQGVEKVPLIQESKSRNSMFVSKEEDCVVCETRFPGSRNTMKIVYSEEVYIRMIIGDDKNRKLYINSLFKKWKKKFPEILLSRKSEISIILLEESRSISDIDYEYFINYVMGIASKTEVCNTILYMLNMCISVSLEETQETDRDHYGYKIFSSSGTIISSLIDRAFNKKTGKIRKRIEEELYSVMKTGTIRINNERRSKMVVQVGTRSDIDIISSTRRIVVPTDYNSTNYPMRQINKSQIGFVCPSETPEGKQVGLIKNLASTCVISPKIDDLYKVILNMISEYQSDEWVIFNGTVIGFSKEDTMMKLLELKRRYRYVSVNKSEKSIFVRTWSGRLMRPLIKTYGKIVTWNNMEKYNWDELVKGGMIEYLDPIELDNLSVAQTSYDGNPEKYTHMEIHPSTMFGIAASTIPFINHNHGARAIFASSMVKQAMQCPPQFERDGKFLVYSQKPLVSTGINDVLNLPTNGKNVLVAIMSYSGYNQEDAIIMKKSFIERGGFSMINNKIKRIEYSIGGRRIIETTHEVNDDKVRAGARKITTHTLEKHGKSIWVIDGLDDKIVNRYDFDKMLSDTEVASSEARYPNVGDKFASRHAQKGVIGRIMNDEDMPFTDEGIIPDIIINPHGIPSRMTMGQILEGIEGRKCSMSGKFSDGTPFQDIDFDNLDLNRKETISGITGETMEMYASIDIVYYLALTHQVIDKIYIRSTGSRSEFSHQPISGRAKGGGLRFGEMEMDLLIAHGASHIIRDINGKSDMEVFKVCSNCGNFPVADRKCCICDSKNIISLEIPYSMKVLKDFMIVHNIDVRILVD